MLPKELPQLPHLEIGVFMKTATEVGGDYYDFKLHDDGTLTAVIGDATGHGMQAGTMVAATKSLFNALADEPKLIEFLKKGTKAIKAMGLKKMFMALTIAKFQDHHMQIAAAGIGLAYLVFGFFAALQGMVEEGINVPFLEAENPIALGSIGFIIAMSVYLSRDFARTNKKIVDQEMEQKLLEAENARQSKELEEARQLQLSMLPKALPQLPHLEIGVFMKTATEVGGDYYDFHLADNGTLTIAIGGH